MSLQSEFVPNSYRPTVATMLVLVSTTRPLVCRTYTGRAYAAADAADQTSQLVSYSKQGWDASMDLKTKTVLVFKTSKNRSINQMNRSKIILVQ
jgi:hypothetical protein